MNHSKIVEYNLNHSKIVDSSFSNPTMNLENTSGNIRSFGKFQTYPVGVYNPAFCGMLLWEIAPGHIMNDYKICQFHMIKCGIIFQDHNAYIFTPITNNDIQSFLKILLRGKILKDNISTSKGVKNLVCYIREKAKKHIIPCIPTIQTHLNHMMGITDHTFSGDENTYLTLLHRIYLMTFMLRYKMPLQRKFRPGNRNLSSSINCFRGKGWYSNLSRYEQKMLNHKDTVIAHESIPDDMLNGVCRSDIHNLSELNDSDIQNTSMFRDNSINTMEFQIQIQSFRHLHTSTKKEPISPHSTLPLPLPVTLNNDLREVPTIEFLQQCVSECMNQLDIPVKDLMNIKSWNSQFHDLLDLDHLREEFPSSVLPKCYGRDKSCGHVLQVNLQEAAINTMHLTMFETMSILSDQQSFDNTSAMFILTVIFHNPLWDIGLQHQLVKVNDDKLYANDTTAKNYTGKCICPCSKLFQNWHQKHHINKLPKFCDCSATVYDDYSDFVKHLFNQHEDYYHRIILRIVQYSYSSLISKIKIPSPSKPKHQSSFGSIHYGKVSLPPYVSSSSEYDTFSIKRNGKIITLTKTNILKNISDREYCSFFSKSSFHKTLKKLTMCGEYNKTKKRSTPMYCYGSTITCTRYPKFFSEGRPQILPRPYFTSKPGQKGSELLNTSWMQSFFSEVERHVLHYLHNLCPDKSLKKVTLFNIELARKIIPQCLRLGGSFFTHMSVFGTINKEDGQMPIHFDERDIISCIFHLGKVNSGGSTSYYSGDRPDLPGERIHQVPFRHGTLQIGFFNKVLHGVDEWDGQHCGIQLNIKKDVLAHFVKYGTKHYDKYRLSGYPQGPIVYF